MRSITPLATPPDAWVRVPGSKSLTNRALLVAALAEGQTTLANALFSEDSGYMAGALQALGFDVLQSPDAARMRVHGLAGAIPARQAALFVGNAGTAARFLTALLTLGQGEYVLDGDARMRQRPIGDLLAALAQLGAGIRAEGPLPGGSLPLRITAVGLPGGRASIPGETSSQFLSALLMVAPYARDAVELEVIPPLNSRPFVEMTLALMADFGLQVERRGRDHFRVAAGRYRAVPHYPIEADATAASYFFAAAAICGGRVGVEGIARPSKQGDSAFLDVLVEMGCEVEARAGGIRLAGGGALRGVAVDLRDMPDTAMTLAAVAPFASTPTRISGIASARVKESDRIAAVCTELHRLGVRVEEHPDGMTIHPCARLRPGVVHTYNDHRMAMAFALIGLRVPGIVIENPDCVSKTFPGFFEVLEGLR